MKILRGLGAFIDAHFDKILLASLFLFVVLRGDEMMSKEMLAALLVLVRGTIIK
jgi:phosphatidylglycerophosphate synthase